MTMTCAFRHLLTFQWAIHFSVGVIVIQFIEISQRKKIRRRFRESLRERFCQTFWQARQDKITKKNTTNNTIIMPWRHILDW